MSFGPGINLSGGLLAWELQTGVRSAYPDVSQFQLDNPSNGIFQMNQNVVAPPVACCAPDCCPGAFCCSQSCGGGCSSCHAPQYPGNSGTFVGPPPVTSPLPPPGTSSPYSQGVIVQVPNVGGLKLEGAPIYCSETGVTLNSTCGSVTFYHNTAGIKHYSVPGGNAGECPSGSATLYRAGANSGDVQTVPVVDIDVLL